ncbi:MAG TPA: hypothetical protein VF020_14000 [Chthoniobacterales bacterium]
MTAGVTDKEMEANKLDPAAQGSLNGERSGGENAQIETEAEGQTLRSRMVEHLKSLLATLLAWAAVSLLGLLFFVARVMSVFSGGRKISKRPTTQMT